MLTRVRNQDQKGFYTVEKPCAYRREGSKIKCFYIGRGGSLSFLKVGFLFLFYFLSIMTSQGQRACTTADIHKYYLSE